MDQREYDDLLDLLTRDALVAGTYRPPPPWWRRVWLAVSRRRWRALWALLVLLCAALAGGSGERLW